MISAKAAERIDYVVCSPLVTIAEAIRRLEQATTGMLLLCAADRRLYGVLTDGDIRRSILRGVPFTQTCGAIASRQPLVALPDVTPAEALRLMDFGREFTINHLPLVDSEGTIAGLVLRSDLVSSQQSNLQAVIMAGGFGTRLLPLTEYVPKPMLPVGHRPLLERTITRLRDAGICSVNVSTHYLSEIITNHFGDGQLLGVNLRYVTEDQPLGTAGALRLMEVHTGPLLVINGDILTDVDFRDMLAYHRAHHADLTIGVRSYELQVPYGVVERNGAYVSGLREKPTLSFTVNAGIYLLESSVYHYIPDNKRFDMTELIQCLLDDGRPVASFPIVEYWLDIGQHTDYEQAQEDVRQGRILA